MPTSGRHGGRCGVPTRGLRRFPRRWGLVWASGLSGVRVSAADAAGEVGGLSPRLSALRRRLECSTLYRPGVSSGGEAVGVSADVEDADELSAAGDVSAGDPFADGALVDAGEVCGGFDVDPYVGVSAGDA